jgi:gliding motility-associated-like protein
MLKQLFFDMGALFKISLHAMKCTFTLLFIIVVVLFTTKAGAQCTALGQNPSTAFPVCGTTSFFQASVPICSGPGLYVPGCTSGGGSTYDNKNSFWYKFTCYQSGTLSFLIKPNTPTDDYDWQLYDVTGINPNDVFVNRNNIVTGNWAGTYGNTGASASGVNYIQCGSDPAANKPTFALSPNLIVGHDYLLLIVHFDDTQSGYSLSFGGGTANITDPLEPHLKYATAPCDGTEIRIKLNKKMKCNSNAVDGSDFTVTAPNGTILNPVSTIADACAAGFDFDSLSIFMAAPLAPGTYTLKAKKGTDGNSLKDNCDREIPVGEAVQFTVFPLLPTPMDSLTKPKCEPDSLVLIFKKNIKCSSIEPSGSDFTITGPYPVTIIAATANCVRGVSNKIVLKLSAPMQVAGNFLVNLKVGTDGNTLIDECDKETPLPDDVSFIVKDTVNANFTETINYTCKLNTVNYFHNGANTISSWLWSFGSAPNSNLQNPVITYTNFEPKITTLIVSNGVCSDTASKQIIFDNYLKADFDVTDIICPNKPAAFKNNSVGRNLTYQWTFGNGNVSSATNPAPQNFVPLLYSDYDARPQLIITNDFGCDDTTYRNVKVVFTCFIAVPSAFTPNGDGKNDFLYPLKAYKSSNLSFSVYNRFGQRVFYTNDWQQKWNGKVKGVPQDAGTYVWTLDYINLESNKHVVEKGTTILIR